MGTKNDGQCFGFLMGLARLRKLSGTVKLKRDSASSRGSSFERYQIGKGRMLTIRLEEDRVEWCFEAKVINEMNCFANSTSLLTYPEFIDFLICDLIPRIFEMTGVRPKPSELIQLSALSGCRI